MINQLGRYKILEELGRGAMGVVYKARDLHIDRDIALKSVDLENLSAKEKEEYQLRFHQEARAAGRLNHPNIVSIHDAGEIGNFCYIAMELLEGRQLQQLLDENNLLSLDEILDIAIQAATGLAYVQQYGIVHRDIKPSNLVVLRDGRIKIVDFGIAKMPFSLISTQTRMIMGSPLYMSPEQVMAHPVDHRSDIFSLGIVLYQILTNQLPFKGEDVHAVMYQIVNAVPPKPSALNVLIPDMLDPIVAKCLAKNPDERYQSASELARDLRACRAKLIEAQAGLAQLKRIGKAGESNIHQLIYESRPSAGIDEDALIDILDRTQYKNLRLGISGLLVFHNGKFMQLLEGEEKQVKELFEIIRRDPRHTDVTVTLETDSQTRIMPSWVMGFHVDSKQGNKVSEQSFYLAPDITMQICASMGGAVGQKFLEFLRT